MCGITGWVSGEKDLSIHRSVIESMTDTLTPRGPDDRGVWISSHAALGHRRLIVVDPSGGRQPMVKTYRGETFVLLYNGELYNTKELQDELKGHGHTFNSHSDTETLLIAYLQWGEGCLDRLNGIYAFAVWHENRKCLFLARDRLGVKPLFYNRRGRDLIFGSELKALLAHPEIRAEVDRDGLAEIFAIGPARTPGHGVFRGVEELKPGHCLTFQGNLLRSKPYWSLESRPHPDDFPTTVSTVRELVQDAIVRQLVADVDVCTFLSGGLDSSAITAIASAEMRKRGHSAIRTYAVDYKDNDRHFRPSDFQPQADTPWIERMSKHLGTSHHNVIIDTPRLVEALTPAVRARDLPGMADIDASLYLFSGEIKKRATVALSGECADEVFGGYPWLRRKEAVHADTFPWAMNPQIRTNILSQDLIHEIKPEKYLQERYREALDEVPELPGESDHEKRMREIFYLNLTRWMPILLDRKDRMSMACSLEVRVPFCDHRIVEYVWNVPIAQKFCDDREKGLLRRALKGILPQDILERRKSPYPKTHHPAYDQAIRRWIIAILDDPSSPILPFINRDKVRNKALKSYSSDENPWFGQLMGTTQLFAYLIQVNTWLKEYRVSVV
ncbi:MAG: asparagine synthase (glutamine-hydrolyzing) [Bacillaceae bacterium]|nr:asparagine synthase (glutamine-hydrolyzing) [Bacillaceae bacterium]